MTFVKKAAFHAGAVAKRMSFIGFTIQIGLGILWMGCNFTRTQDFGEPDSRLYRGLFRLCGENPCLLYLLQLAVAFYAGYLFLRKLHMGLAFCPASGGGSRGRRSGKGFMAWGSLALLTFPFALQCHLAVQPHSFMGSFFLLMLSFLLDLFGLSQGGTSVSGRGGFGAGRLGALLSAIACAGLAVVLSGAADAERLEGAPTHNLQSAMASRLAWPDIWNDAGDWPEDLREMTKEVLWEASRYPGNMDILLKTIEDEAGAEAAKEYYWQIAKTGWENHAYMVVRQIGWDVLGYGVTPVIFQLQMEGEAYDSYTGRNYEIMRGNAPVLTKYYVDYGCWWFCCSLALAFCLGLVNILTEGADGWKRWSGAAGICILASAVVVFLLTMRGAGIMDYKYTAAVNELWLTAGILLLRPVREREG